MDVDFWATRVHSSNHLPSVQAARLNFENHLCLDDSEGDDDARASFPCPFCYVDIEVPLLSIHLEQEHCFDVKNSVCPLCAASFGKDMIAHFTVRHSQMLKGRRKSQRSGFWSNGPAMLGKELRDLRSFLGVATKNGRASTPDLAPDPLLSPFLCLAPSGAQETGSKVSPSSPIKEVKRKDRTVSSQVDETQEHEYEERGQRAEFAQQLVLSTIF